jgi:hypothetical protein
MWASALWGIANNKRWPAPFVSSESRAPKTWEPYNFLDPFSRCERHSALWRGRHRPDEGRFNANERVVS